MEINEVVNAVPASRLISTASQQVLARIGKQDEKPFILAMQVLKWAERARTITLGEKEQLKQQISNRETYSEEILTKLSPSQQAVLQAISFTESVPLQQLTEFEEMKMKLLINDAEIDILQKELLIVNIEDGGSDGVASEMKICCICGDGFDLSAGLECSNPIEIRRHFTCNECFSAWVNTLNEQADNNLALLR